MLFHAASLIGSEGALMSAKEFVSDLFQRREKGDSDPFFAEFQAKVRVIACAPLVLDCWTTAIH
jgi:hypothetical protein